MSTLKANSKVFEKALKGQRARYTIEGHTGLHLFVRGDGNGSWMLRYRAAGKRAWHTLHSDALNAVFADVTTAKDKWLAKVKLEGVDPKEERRAEIAAKLEAEQSQKLTLAIVVDEWIAKPRATKTLRPRTVALYRWLFEKHLVPALGTRPIAEITRDELKAHFAKLTANMLKTGGRDGKGSGVRGETAGKLFTYSKAVFEFAIDEGYIVANPMRGLVRPVPTEPDEKASRPLRPEELKAVWYGAEKHLTPSYARMVKLALLLGRRRAEIAGAERDELRLDDVEPSWLIRARAGNKSSLESLCPLPGLAASIMRDALAAAGQSAFVFPMAENPARASLADELTLQWRALCMSIGAEL